MLQSTRLSPECRLVFRSADPGCGATEFAALAGAVRDWERAVLLAEREVATSALWQGLRESGAAVPDEVAAYLRRSAMVLEFRMVQLAERLQRTVRVLAAGGIPVLLLKGAALGALLDPTFRLRPMTDVDLLVRQEDIARAHRAVLEAGWTATADPALSELYSEHHHLPPFTDAQLPGSRLELHSALLPADHSFGFDESHLWRDSDAAPAPFLGASLPSREHLLMHACVHFAWQHEMQFGAWRTLRAVGLLIRTPEFDWERFVRLAWDGKAATSCHWTLRLAARLSGIALPSGVLGRLASPTPEWINGALERSFIADLASGEGPVSPSIAFSRLLWRTALRPRWSGHRSAGRLDPGRRWQRAQGKASVEAMPQRAWRHLRGFRDWWRFVARTLLGVAPVSRPVPPPPQDRPSPR